MWGAGEYSGPMNSSTWPALDESLADAEYDRLEAMLAGNQGEHAMNLEEMDGFLAALICGPETVPPSIYLAEIWGGRDRPQMVAATLEEFLNLVMRHWNLIARTLAAEDFVFVPLLIPEDGEELPRGNRWAEGFLRGIALCRAAWDEIMQDDEKFAMLLPIAALAHENDPDPEMRTWKTPPDEDLRKTVIAGLSVATQTLYDYFLRRRTGKVSGRPVGIRGARQKIGRNDPCYCGSGKKYKRCCGDVTIQ